MHIQYSFFILVPLFFYCYGDLGDLHSFPTRRSSDLSRALDTCPGVSRPSGRAKCVSCRPSLCARAFIHARSEEHTSELQSLRHLVCRLLLEKKKKKKKKKSNL